ncbi:MAG: CHRD domain-containing protein [Nitrosopumilales archaeon]|nr:MAG: CHRD domain-containing protein [Nitrosopumilales archaeon]
MIKHQQFEMNSRLLLTTILVLAVSLSALLTLPTVDQIYAVKRIYDAPLSGENEVPPVQSSATGLAEFTPPVNDTIKYRINITGISNATGAHIHSGQASENGEVIADLLTDTTKNKDTSYGMTIRGNLSDSSLKGPMEGKTLEDLVAAMDSGETYVNVHTAEHPDGEIRGQVINTEKAESAEQAESTNSTTLTE